MALTITSMRKVGSSGRSARRMKTNPQLRGPRKAGPAFAVELKRHFPWIGTGESISGADVVQELIDWYNGSHMSRSRLKLHFPWLGTDEPVSGADVIDEVNSVYRSLSSKRKRTGARSHNPYKVMTSFGGEELGEYRTRTEANESAKYLSETRGHPIDVWSGSGGALGKGRRVAHYVEGKNVPVTRRNSRKHSPYRVMESFGGAQIGPPHMRRDEAYAHARHASATGSPVDVWSTSGGQMGQGKRLAHFVEGRQTPTGRRQAISMRRKSNARSPSLWLLEQNVGGVWKPRFRGPDKRGVEMILPTQKELHPGSKWRIRRHVTGSKKNPSRARGANRIFEVHVPDSPGDMGYKIKIRAKTVSAAREEARKYCAKQSVRHIHGGGGRAGSGQFLRDIYKLPPGTKVKEVSQ